MNADDPLPPGARVCESCGTELALINDGRGVYWGCPNLRCAGRKR